MNGIEWFCSSYVFLPLIFLDRASAETLVSPPNEPNWVLLMVVFIVSSAVAAVVGVVALVKSPEIPEPPEFREPSFDRSPSMATSVLPQSNNLVVTSYKQYPLEYEPNSYPMEAIQSRRSDNPTMGSQQQFSVQEQQHTLQSQPSYQPITVMTQRM
ncbi:unnamed protein product [Clavelina lepadiformis]|uniref:Uncharacterized protein n=1 Tax=Clavelina lepadiformis TaxID=159417 RepID=A0ABP0GRF9_CLALP